MAENGPGLCSEHESGLGRLSALRGLAKHAMWARVKLFLAGTAGCFREKVSDWDTFLPCECQPHEVSRHLAEHFGRERVECLKKTR